MAAKKKAKRRLVIDVEAQAKARELIRKASTLLKKHDDNVTQFRSSLASSAEEYGHCTKGSCDFCDAARLIRRADRIRAKAA